MVGYADTIQRNILFIVIGDDWRQRRGEYSKAHHWDVSIQPLFEWAVVKVADKRRAQSQPHYLDAYKVNKTQQLQEKRQK